MFLRTYVAQEAQKFPQLKKNTANLSFWLKTKLAWSFCWCFIYPFFFFFPAWHKGRLFGEARSNSEGKRQICFYSVGQMKLKCFFSRTGNKDGSRSTDTNWNTSKTKWWVYSLRAVVCTQNLRKALRNPSGNTESTSWSAVLSSLIFNIVLCPPLTDPKIIGQLPIFTCYF